MKPWEPLDELMYLAFDDQAQPMKSGELQEDERQTYCSVLIGFDLDDAYGHSVAEVITGEGREADEALAKVIVEFLKLATEISARKPRQEFEQLLERLGIADLPEDKVSLGYSFFQHGWYGRTGHAAYQQTVSKEADPWGLSLSAL